MVQDNSHDGLGWRSRMRPRSTGKRITPQSRDLLWFSKLSEHGPLPSSFLLEYSAGTHRSAKRAQERLTDLFHEANTPDGGAYLSRPPQQIRTIDSRYNQLVYDLTGAGQCVVLERGLSQQRPFRGSGPWVHQLMVSCITASFDLACLVRDDIHFIPQSYLLARAKAELRYPVEARDPTSGTPKRKDLIPDAIFGLEYKCKKGSKYRCFVIEADRSSEPATSSNFNRKSWQRALAQYNSYIGQGLYRQHLNLTSPLILLIVVPDQKRLEQIAKLIPSYAPLIQQQIMLQTWTDFGDIFRPPYPNPKFLNDKWTRANDSGYWIG